MTIKVNTWPNCSVIRGHSTTMVSPKKPTHAEFVWSYANGCSNFVFLYEVYEKRGTSGSIIVWCVYIYADCPIRTFHRSRYRQKQVVADCTETLPKYQKSWFTSETFIHQWSKRETESWWWFLAFQIYTGGSIWRTTRSMCYSEPLLLLFTFVSGNIIGWCIIPCMC